MIKTYFSNHNLGHEIISKVIRINVGGKVFETSMDTLLRRIHRCNHEYQYENDVITGGYYRIPDADRRPNKEHKLFKFILSSKDRPFDSIFIDRNPMYFEFILDYLRTSEMRLSAFLKSEYIYIKIDDDRKDIMERILIEEFRFYGIID